MNKSYTLISRHSLDNLGHKRHIALLKSFGNNLKDIAKDKIIKRKNNLGRTNKLG